MKYSIIIIVIYLFGTCTIAQELKELEPTSISLIEIDQDLVDNFNTKESLDRCYKVWDQMEREGRTWKEITSEEKNILKYCGEVRQSPWEIVGGGCSWYCGSGTGKQTASSFLAAQGNNSYKPSNAHDLSYQTAWVEGVEGYGIGEYIEYEFPAANPRINTVIVVNGYVKSYSSWINNSRAKKMKMYVNDKPYAVLNLEDKRASQEFSVATIGESNRKDYKILQSKKPWKIRFEIIEVFKGAKYDDVAISEIYFDGLDVHCLGIGTKISMADGTLKNIELLTIGEEVLSYNKSTRALETSIIEKIATPFHGNLVRLTFDNGASVISTKDHPFLSDGQWMAISPIKTMSDYTFDNVDKLEIGTNIKTIQGDVKLVAIQKINSKQKTFTIVKLNRNDSFIANGFIVGTEELRTLELSKKTSPAD